MKKNYDCLYDLQCQYDILHRLEALEDHIADNVQGAEHERKHCHENSEKGRVRASSVPCQVGGVYRNGERDDELQHRQQAHLGHGVHVRLAF